MNDDTAHAGTRYRIDASRGRFTVQAFAEGMLSFMGHDPIFAVRRYGGEIQFADDGKQVASMLVVAEAASLALRDNVSAKDRAEIETAMRESVLETGEFAEIYFASKDVSLTEQQPGKFSVTARGVLSLRGETRPQTIEAAAAIEDQTVRASGEFVLRQSEFGIEPFKALGGTLKVKDEVRIAFDITAAV